ncbi:MAG: heavy metal-binding domain-containing protein [Deltaproteobacteria bacterium]|jgi:uncharacterized protein YbjQ (UPF0145 family)|nr:heavy metal-binding domain-containing protein [Deltaproteobacteria bacterium]
MNKICIRCGTDLGALTGASEESITKIEQLRQWEIEVPSPLCASCFGQILDQAQNRYGQEFLYPQAPPQKIIEEMRKKSLAIELFTFNPYDKGAYKNLGFVSAHVVLGTGPLTTLATAVTDLMGRQSDLYVEKIKEAEAACLYKLKTIAHKRLATAVIGLNVSYQELTSNHGMIMISMTGTAVAL